MVLSGVGSSGDVIVTIPDHCDYSHPEVSIAKSRYDPNYTKSSCGFRAMMR